MPKPGTLTNTSTDTTIDSPWNVLVHDDPVNMMGYVTWVLIKIFGYPEAKASGLMMQVHQGGRAVVWTGEREKAELYMQQLHSHQLKSTLEKTD
ncbi:MAG: ATP-dependent Clp protease adapter ClpS [Luteolibacter sp.]